MKAVHVFDYDETLCHSNSLVHVSILHNGSPVEIEKLPGWFDISFKKTETSQERVKYSFENKEYAQLLKLCEENQVQISFSNENNNAQEGYNVVLDFSDFFYVDHERSTPIKRYLKRLKRCSSTSDVWILTARKTGVESCIQKFVFHYSGIQVPLERIICVGGWGGKTYEDKSKALLTKIIPSNTYDEVYFYDDDQRNLDSALLVLPKFCKTHLINSVTNKVIIRSKKKF